jgi:hypothetical protein
MNMNSCEGIVLVKHPDPRFLVAVVYSRLADTVELGGGLYNGLWILNPVNSIQREGSADAVVYFLH